MAWVNAQLAAGVLVTGLLAGGCSASAPARPGVSHGATSAPPVTTSPAAPARATHWPLYHATAARTGLVTGLPAAGPLSIAWHRGLDGAVYGQPLVIGGVVVAATENDSV